MPQMRQRLGLEESISKEAREGETLSSDSRLPDLRQLLETDLLSTGLKEDGVEEHMNPWSGAGGRKSAVKE